MLAEVQTSVESMGKALDDDKQRQQDLLKRRLEARKRKRNKLKEDLDVVDGEI